MNRVITASIVAGAFALGITVPSSAAPASPAPPTSPASDAPAPGALTMEERGVFQRDQQTATPPSSPSAPPRVEGIAGGYVYVPVTPYRTMDSRTFGIDGYVFGGEDVYFSVLVDEFNVPRVPDTAVAVTYNLTVVETLGAGFCSLYPGSLLWPGNSSINWTATNQTIANGGTVAIDFYTRPGQVSVYCGPAANLGTHYILDITGYYF